jgi:hypothetical protein
MAIERSSADDAKTSNDPNDFAQNGAKAGADKSNGSKSRVAVEERRQRAFSACFSNRRSCTDCQDWYR